MVTDLFQPFRIGRLELRNRFVRSATRDLTADSSGAVTDKSVALYRELGQGGVGLIVSGVASVSTPDQTDPIRYGAHNDDMIPGLRRLVQAAHQGGAKIALQIGHGGILYGQGTTTLAVSRMPEMSTPHQEMTGEEIENVIADFAAAAVRGRDAGFDAIQLHGAHARLMSQFLSPLFNRRNDRWGGSAENRRRFHLEVIRKVRHAIGADFPLIIKFGVQDDWERGLTLNEGSETARQMVDNGIDAIEVSTGSGRTATIAPSMRVGDPERAPFRERAGAIKRAIKVPVMVVAGIRSLEMAKDIVDSGDADLISMCRPFIREPGLIARWQTGKLEPARCISCNKCLAVMGRGEPLECGEELRLKEEAHNESK